MKFQRYLFGLSFWLAAGWALLVVPNTVSASEAVTLSGVVIPGGITCPMLKLASGEAVSLMGVAALNTPVGQDFSATGSFVRISTCQQSARTFRVETIVNPDLGAQ